MSKREKAEF